MINTPLRQLMRVLAGALILASATSWSAEPAHTKSLIAATVEVPRALIGPPFDQTRQLRVPTGFGVRVVARVTDARFLTATPDGNFLVSVPSSGTIILVKPKPGRLPEMTDFAVGLHSPHDMVFYRQGDKTWLYVSETNQVSRYVWTDGMAIAGEQQIVVANLPNSNTPGLQSRYVHPLKNIAISPAGKLFVAIASSCNACAEDTQAEPVRGSIYVYDLDGKNGRLYARGLRNAEGLDVQPGSEELWVAVNNRDNIAYPYRKDFDGDGRSDYGKVMQTFVDDNPPEPFTRVRNGGDYGWPYCNPDPRSASGVFDMPFDRDVQLNPDGDKRNCTQLDHISLGLPAHTAPLGMSFLQDSGLPGLWRKGAAISLHGCWNCSKLNGNKVIFVPFTADGKPAAPQDMVSGWVTDARAKTRWGRPVDVVPSGHGSLLISDDYSGTVYELYAK